jgi:hypothetical protein
MTATDALKRHRSEVLRLAAHYGATDVRVFGSVARGEADDASDIDLIVRMGPGRSVFDPDAGDTLHSPLVFSP